MAGSGFAPAGMSCCHSFLPVPASKANTCNFGFLPLGADIPVQNTRPAATTGEPMPSPSTADQRTFLVGEKVSGKVFFEVETPEQLEPRNCGQSSAVSRPPGERSRPAARATVQTRKAGRMRRLLGSKPSRQDIDRDVRAAQQARVGGQEAMAAVNDGN